MSTIHFPHYEGQTLLGDLREIDGTAIELGVAATEITPSLYSVMFTAVPDGLYRFIARDATRTAFNDTVTIRDTETVNIVTSQVHPSAAAATILQNPDNPIVTNAMGAVTTSNPTTGGVGSAHTPADVAAAILETPANKLATNADGQVTPDGSVKKLGDRIRHTNVGSVENVSDDTIETRV